MGAFTLDENLKIDISEKANGNGIDEWLFRFQGKQIFIPKKSVYIPDELYTDWHFREVFKNYQMR